MITQRCNSAYMFFRLYDKNSFMRSGETKRKKYLTRTIKGNSILSFSFDGANSFSLESSNLNAVKIKKNIEQKFNNSWYVITTYHNQDNNLIVNAITPSVWFYTLSSNGNIKKILFDEAEVDDEILIYEPSVEDYIISGIKNIDLIDMDVPEENRVFSRYMFYTDNNKIILNDILIGGQ